MRRVIPAILQKGERHFQGARFAIIDSSDEPVLAAAPRDGREFSNLAVDHPRVVPHRRHLLEKLNFRLALIKAGPVVPENPLQRTKRNDRHRQLMRVGGLDALVIITNRVIGRPRRIARKGNRAIVFGRGKMLVAPDALDGQQVRILAGQTHGTVAVVDVQHEMVLRRLPHRFRHPRRLLLRADIYESNLDTFHAPFFVKRKKNVALLLDLLPVHVKNYPDIFRAPIPDNLREVQIGRANGGGIPGLVLGAIPPGVQRHILQTAFLREINNRLGIGGRQRRVAHHLARLDPGNVRQRRRRRQVKQKIIPLQQVARLFPHDECPPRGGRAQSERRRPRPIAKAVAGGPDGVGACAAQCADQRSGHARQRGQQHARIVFIVRLRQRGEQAVGKFQSQRALAPGLNVGHAHPAILSLRAVLLITKRIRGKAKFRPLDGENKIARSRVRRERIAKGGAFVVGAERQAHGLARLRHQVNHHLAIIVGNDPALTKIIGPFAVVRTRRTFADLKTIGQSRLKTES